MIYSRLWSILNCDQFSIVIYSRLWSILDTWARHSKQLFSLSSERSPSPPYGTKPFSWEAKIWSASDHMFNLSVWSFGIKCSYLFQNKLLTWCDQIFQHKSIMFLQRNHVEFVQLFQKTCWKKPPHLQNSGSIWSRELEGWEYLKRFSFKQTITGFIWLLRDCNLCNDLGCRFAVLAEHRRASQTLWCSPRKKKLSGVHLKIKKTQRN